MTDLQHSGASAHAAGRVGPNAIIRVAEALREIGGVALEENLLGKAGLQAYLAGMPAEMVDEREVTRLQRAVQAELDPQQARLVMLDAGRRTGDYLLANRIPHPVQHVLRVLPAALASRVLLVAIGRNAWTFAGSGHLGIKPGQPVRLTLTGCPLCCGAVSDAPICEYYAATFERLFRQLVSSRAVTTETSCQASGAPACVFEVRW
jgi:divinyl protochlorophyllide a 8-vinyl-reductase